MYPISDLTAFCRRTTGDVPPKLVGASTTVVGSKMYLYGGRLVSERRMVSDIYMFDLETFVWEKLVLSPDDEVPQARYFHSADAWNNHLVVFGGMSIRLQSDNPEDLCVLNDVRLFDLGARRWVPLPSNFADASPNSLAPNARYAHLSSVTSNRLFIIGGQDLNNVWLDDIYIFDLNTKVWVSRRDYPRHCGTYRSVAVTADMRVRLPQEEMRATPTSPKLGKPGARFKVDQVAPATAPVTQSEALIHLPYSAAPTEEYPCDIYLFSNYNFTDVQRELEVFTPLPNNNFAVTDKSNAMTGTSFPPGLRFPTGAILGTYFIVAGTYISQTYQSFSIWALDMVNMTWSRIDPGSALAKGSWFRGCLQPSANRFLVFGNRHGSLVEDYNRRLLSWDHVVCIDLEAFGIYQPPRLLLDVQMQELGLAALEEGLLSDFEIICDDGRKVKCSRKLLEDRWPWFKEQRRLFVEAATRAIETMPSISQHVPLPEVQSTGEQEPRPDPRLTPRSFHLSEPYPVTLAFVQYFYSMGIITPLQHAPAVLSQLLLLSSTYELDHLRILAKHAMHRALSYATSVGIYGVSTLCSCRSLQIRALRVVMAYSQRRPPSGRTRIDRDGSSGSRNTDANGGPGPHSGNGRSDAPGAARPRGMSDASYLRGPESGASSPGGRGYVNANGAKTMRFSMDNSVPMTHAAQQLIRASSESGAGGHRADLHVQVEGLSIQEPMSASSSLPPMKPPPTQRAPSPATHLFPEPPSGTLAFRRQQSAIHDRAVSIISMNTDSELCAVADMMLFASEKDESVEPELADPLDKFPLPTPEEIAALFDDTTAQIEEDARAYRYSTSSQSPTAVKHTSLNGSIYADSEGGHSVAGYGDSAALLSPSSAAFPAYHLPRSAMLRNRDSDTPSLSSSISVLSTPSLSRPSSVQQLPYTSPPVSPTIATPTDALPMSPYGRNHLGVIQEVRTSEDLERPAQYQGDGFEGKTPYSNIPNAAPRPSTTSECDSTQTGDDAHSDQKAYRAMNRPESLAPSQDSSLSARSDSPSWASSDKSNSGGALGRLFSKDRKRSSSGNMVMSQSHFSSSEVDLKATKAEEKQRKKQEAKEKAERLAQELKEKDLARKRATNSDKKSVAGRPKNNRWEERAVMSLYKF